MSGCDGAISIKESAAGIRTLRLLLAKLHADSVDNEHVINRTQIAGICVINKHACAGFDRSLDDLARFVQNAAVSIHDVTRSAVRVVFSNNERSDGLITGSRSFLSRHFDDRPGHRYWF